MAGALRDGRVQGQALRINREKFSKSIEQQIDVYTKTREDIRKILQLAKNCSVNDKSVSLTEYPLQSSKIFFPTG